MSSTLVRKALEIVDPEFHKHSKGNRHKSNVFKLMPENQKVTTTIRRKGHNEKVGVLQTSKKFTVVEAQKTFKSKEAILRENLKKLAKIKEVCRIKLDKETTEKIVERAVTGRPVKDKKRQKKQQKTAFTEEDFKKFEEEYLAE